MKERLKRAALLMFALGPLTVAVLAPTANATLISRLGGQAVYDTDLDITWIADANLAASNVFGLDPNDPTTRINPDGAMNWFVAYYDWLPALNADGGTGYLGFNDWRLPATLQPDLTCSTRFSSLGSIGSGCTGSEMGHLFYEELGGAAGVSILDSGDPDLALFQNLEALGNVLGIWSDTCCIIPPGGIPNDFAYYFLFDSGTDSGQQNAGPKLNPNGLWIPWAVRDGDVLSVPEPSTLVLMGIGVIGLGWIGRRKKTSQ